MNEILFPMFAFCIMIVNFVLLITNKLLFVFYRLWKIVLKTHEPRVI